MAKPIFKGDGFIIENNIIKSTEEICQPNNDNYIGKIIFDSLSSYPKHVGQIDAETDVASTFEDMKNKSVSLAVWLKKQGITSGDIVANCLPIHPDVYSIIFSTMFIGATYCAWDIEMNMELACYYLNLIEPKILITCQSKVDMLQEAARLGNHKVRIVVLGDNFDKLESFEDILKMQRSIEIENFSLPNYVDPQSACLITFSSGTTGLPKALLHSYEQSYNCAITIGLKETSKDLNEIVLMYCYPSWSVHFWCLQSFVINKATQIIHGDIHDADEISKVIEKYQVTYLLIHTHTLVSICFACAENNYNLGSIKKIYSVGSKLSEKVMKTIKRLIPTAFVEIMYGLSETNITTRNTGNCKNLTSVGTILPGVQLKIIDHETGKTLGPNEDGEICLKTPTMMIGYYKSPTGALTFDDDGWLHTGDKGYFNEAGEIMIVGRFKDIIKYQFYDVMPSYVEDLLRTHPNIVDAAVVAVPHEIDGERAVAFVITVPNSKVSREEINELVSQLEFPDLLNDRIYFIKNMPYNTNGKLKRRLLIEMAKKFGYLQ